MAVPQARRRLAWWVGAALLWAACGCGDAQVEEEGTSQSGPRRLDPVVVTMAATDEIEPVVEQLPVETPPSAFRTRKKPPRTRALPTVWHAPPEPEDCPALQAAAPGSWGMLPVGTDQCFVLPALPELDSAGPAVTAIAESAFLHAPSGQTHAVHPRLLAMVYRAVREFEVPYIHVISGYRPGRRGSRHTYGLAVDVVFPGVRNPRLAEFMRNQGFMGVGVYKRTGFVHLDVRERSYYWLDWSPPGKKWRGKQVRAEQAETADAEATARGEASFEPPPELRRATEARAARRARRAKARRAGEARAGEERAKAKRKAEPSGSRAARSNKESEEAG